MGIFDRFKNNNRHSDDRAFLAQRADLLRHYEILKESENFVNHSPNFSTVLGRYDLVLDELSYFAAYESFGVDYLEKYGIIFKTPASVLWRSYFDNRATYLNAAVDRLIDLEIDNALTLKTKTGQEKRMISVVEKIQDHDGVPFETLKYVGSIPVVDALREPKVLVSCRCGHKFRGRPHAHKGYIVVCPKCDQKLRVDTSKNKPK